MMKHSRQQLYAKVRTLLFLNLFSLFSLMVKKTKEESYQSGRNLINQSNKFIMCTTMERHMGPGLNKKTRVLFTIDWQPQPRDQKMVQESQPQMIHYILSVLLIDQRNLKPALKDAHNVAAQARATVDCYSHMMFTIRTVFFFFFFF